MNFENLSAETIRLRVKPTNGAQLDTHFQESTSPCITAIVPSALPNVFDLVLATAIVPVSPIELKKVRQLNQLLGMGRALLAELADPAADGSAELKIAFFPGAILDWDELEIGADEYVEQQSGNFGQFARRDVQQWLADECMITVGGESFFQLSAGPAIEEELESIDRPDLSASVSESFCIVGQTIRFIATLKSLEGGPEVFVISKLTKKRGGTDGSVRLARGTLRFTDWTRTGQVKLLARAQLEHLAADRSSYMRRWDEYLNLEGESFLKDIRAFGVITYSTANSLRNETVSVRVEDASEVALERLGKMERDDALSCVDEIPSHLVDSEMTFVDFCTEIRRTERAKLALGIQSQTGFDRLPVDDWNRETKTLRLRTEMLPTEGRLVLATRGQSAQIKRRLEARDAVLQGRTANPQLGLLIEDGGQPTSLRSPQKVKPLSAFVREKVFRNPPTPMQERAIEVALNTPDIALIQGPPGTGKTTVIAAILERLNELSTNDGVIRAGEILLTGFQHDAVENLIDRISLNGLPVPKFGDRSGSNDADKRAFESNLSEWCHDIAVRLREQNPQIARHEEEREVQDLYAQYLRMPSQRLGMTLMRRLSTLGSDAIDVDLCSRILALLQQLSTRALLDSEQDHFLPAVRQLRTRGESFADDGPERSAAALVDLIDILSDSQTQLLRRASSWSIDRGTPPFLQELADLKRSLLRQLAAPPVFRVEKHNDEVIEIATAAIQSLHEKGLSAIDRKIAALAGFLSELENDPKGIVDAVSTYSFAFSATVQQSVSGELRRRKKLDGLQSSQEDTLLQYEYVIVDEAARVAPPDLMIALAQGKKIILVGDHRQLPHMIEKKIADEMDAGNLGLGEHGWLQKSMFEHLFSDRLKALEERDGIQRRVTLDKQFRMHPVLGDFISRVFYERNDIVERFGSALPAEAFAHNLPGTRNQPALWLDVPTNAGPTQRPDHGHSYSRQAEVDAIVQQLEQWIQSPEGQDLTYGIISFYKAQEDELRAALEGRLGQGVIDEKRIRVGTVDSFQGMEFDVVFLSIVRTARPSNRSNSTGRADEAMSVFGHLCLSNRLNVSMSRQKRLLVAVGDSALVAHPLATEFIPGLVEFYRMTSRY